MRWLRPRVCGTIVWLRQTTVAPSSCGGPRQLFLCAQPWRRADARQLRTSAPLHDSETGLEGGGSGNGEGSLSPEHRLFLEVLREMLAEDGLPAHERSAVQSAISATLAGRGAEAMAAIEHAALKPDHQAPLSEKRATADEADGPELAAALDAAPAPTAGPDSEEEARTLFSNLSQQAERPIDHHRLRERNMRRLSREQSQIDEDLENIGAWADANKEQIDRFAAEEQELLHIMKVNVKGSEAGNYSVADEGIGEDELLWGAYLEDSAGGFSPPIDRLDPTVAHSPEFDYTFQEMMQANADDESKRLIEHQRNIARLEDINKQRGQRQGPERVRDVDADGRSFATGHKKSAIARVCLIPGTGRLRVNGRLIDQYFAYYHRHLLLEPFELTGTLLLYDMEAKVKGGGLGGQLDAVKYGIARALQKQDPAHRAVLKRAGLLTRDARKVERKKSGQLKARKKFTWVKR